MTDVCRHGHPWEGNEIWCKNPSGRPYRKCAECQRQAWHQNKHRWRKKERNQAARVAAWRERNPEKWAAQQIVKKAIKDGVLVRPDVCGRCGEPPTGKGRIEASHDDYDRPLDVEWLCRSCHGAKDRPHAPVRVSTPSNSTAHGES